MEERIFAIARYALGVFLILSGIGILLDPTKTVEVIEYAYAENQDILPGDARFQTMALAIVEILAGLLFIAEKLLYAPIVASLIILMTFILPLRDTVMGRTGVPTCGCSGFLDFNLPIGWLLLRNAVIMITLFWMMSAIQYRRVSYSKGKPRQRTLLEMVFQKKQE